MKLNKKKLLNHSRQLRKTLLDIIFPIECLSCGREGQWLCRSCFSSLEFNKNQYCLACKKTNHYGEFCGRCRGNFSLNGVLIAGNYENKVIARLIKSLKYHFAGDIAAILGKYLSLFLRNLINQNRLKKNLILNGFSRENLKKTISMPDIISDLKNTIIIPVPLHKKRKRWRGFNQAEKLAEVIAKNFNLVIDHNGLVRAHYQKPQAKLNEAERKINLIGCFAWLGQELNRRNIILVDDVSTTGSTLEECARTLKKHGAGEIFGLVTAKG